MSNKIVALVHYATKSKKYPRFTKEMEFNNEGHLRNFLAKSAREGKKIIGHDILTPKENENGKDNFNNGGVN